MASLESPSYTATILNSAGAKYNITNAITDLTLEELESGIAQKVSLRMKQLRHDGKWTTNLFNVHDRMYVYANTGSGAKEVFRGYIWEDVYEKSDTQELIFTAYDRLIYLQESEEYKYYSAGKSTKAIFQDICSNKGITLKYSYESITHSKLALRGTLSDIFEDDLLEAVRRKKGKRGIVRDTKGTMEVFTEGSGNSTVYKLYNGAGGNLISTKHTETMDGITTKVIILGSEKDGARAPIKATVKGKTDQYGTIQKILTSSDSDKLSEVKEEANQIIKDKGTPQKYIEISAIDNPWIRKGDTIYLQDGYRTGYAYVKSISHDALKKIMSLEVRMA